MTSSEWFDMANEINGVLEKHGLQIGFVTGLYGDDLTGEIRVEPIEKKQYSKCLRCGRTLKNPIAQERGYGDVCWNKQLRDTQTKLF